MSTTRFGSVLRLFLAAILVLTAAGCDYYPRHPGPPPRANAPYYYDYYYYPHADVYFHIYTGEYYYRDGRDWRRARNLPPKIYLDPRDRHQLRIQSDKPYADDQARRRAQPQPGYRYQPDPARNRQERQYNRKRNEEYRKKYRN